MSIHVEPIHHDQLVKVVVNLEPSDWHSYSTESLWAEPLEDDLFVIRNVAFYATGLSYEDVVRAFSRDGDLVVEGVKRPGGHSTYRFITTEGTAEDQWRRYWLPLESIGCTYERGTERLFAVDVPREADIYRTYELLDAGERAGVWGFQEGHCGHPLKN